MIGTLHSWPALLEVICNDMLLVSKSAVDEVNLPALLKKLSTMTTVFNETKENHPAGHVTRAEVVSGMSTPEKLIGRPCENSVIATPAKKRCRVSSVPLSAIPVWRPEPSNIWTKVTKVSKDYSTRSECPSSPTQYRIGSKRRHPEHRTCPCKRPILDFSKMCETSYVKLNDKRDSIIIPKGIGLDIVSLCEEPEMFSIRPIHRDTLCIVNKTPLSTVNIDLDSIERD
ncbi:uncharacterized protein LOC134822696 isoform X2 [Bolinopsis microptera]|uniref:uncharacterized protein LOC134822696 isoform X2 n=1 Tax=Bolinopsis microptera TaxID=2820187 RepID=UPI00307915E0